jgi:hypothetical protein
MYKHFGQLSDDQLDILALSSESPNFGKVGAYRISPKAGV